MNELLELACRVGNSVDVRKLLSEGADPNSGYALYYASVSNYVEIVKMLLEYGAKPNTSSSFSGACFCGCLPTVKLLLEYGADPNLGALYTACYHTEVVKLLLQHGADPFRTENNDNKIETLTFIIENNLVGQEWIEKNKDRIPQEVWSNLYE